MSEMERAKEIDEAVRAADAKKRADAEEAAMAGEKLDKIIAHLDALSKRMDAWDEKSKSKDEEGEGEGEIERKGQAQRAWRRFAVRKDSAADAEEIENYKREIGATHKIAADSRSRRNSKRSGPGLDCMGERCPSSMGR